MPDVVIKVENLGKYRIGQRYYALRDVLSTDLSATGVTNDERRKTVPSVFGFQSVIQ